MRAEVRTFEWTDANYEIQDGKEVSLPTLLVLHAGGVGGRGADLFHVEITTPEAFRAVIDRTGILLGRHYLIVDNFSRPRVEAFVSKLISQRDEASWDDLAAKIRRLAYWEFEDYREAR
jgi:hypothetical protein